MDILEKIYESVIGGKHNDSKKFVEQALEEGIAPKSVLNDGLLKAMGIVGDKFKNNEIYLPEMLMSSRAMKTAMQVLQPGLTATHVEPVGTAVMGTIKGDLHDIGKNLVCMMLEGAGFKVVDVGVDADDQKFLKAVQESGASVVGLSALLTTTMSYMKNVTETIRASDAGGNVRIMVGGAPINQTFCDEIGADGYAPDAASAADLAKKLIS